VGLPPLLCSFPPTATFTSFPAPGCWACAATPSFSGQLMRNFPSPPSVLRVPRPLCYISFCCYCLLFSFSFFPGWGSVSPGGYAALSQDCLWEYHILHSSPCGPCLPKMSGRCCLGALLVSPFNVKWRCYAQAWGVEESKFCLLWVVFPVRCISSVSSRFYFRRHTFCHFWIPPWCYFYGIKNIFKYVSGSLCLVTLQCTDSKGLNIISVWLNLLLPVSRLLTSIPRALTSGCF
jgi:hypothetical protein